MVIRDKNLRDTRRCNFRVVNILEESRFGGPQARVVSVARRLKKHGIETIVFLSRYDSEKLSLKLSENGVTGVPLNITRLSKEKRILIKYIFRFFPEIYLLYSLFKKERFDLIHVNGSYQIKGAIAGRLAGIPVIWHLNDTGMSAVIKKLCVFIAKYCAVGFIVAGKRVYDYYIRGSRLEGRPYIEIQAPVDTTIFDPKCVVGDSHVKAYDGVKILTVANINPAKGLENFVEMAYDLTQQYDNLHFYIAGAVYSSQSGYYKKLKDLVASKGLTNLVFLGRSYDIPYILKAADICVFTSLTEASPTSVWEAMAMAKPIVTTEVGDVSTYIKDGEEGFVVPVGDVKALTEKVDMLIKDDKMRKEFGQKARYAAVRNLDIEICVEKHRKFYFAINERAREVAP